MTKKKFNLTEWTPQPQQRESAPSVPVAVPENLQDSDIEIVTQRIERLASILPPTTRTGWISASPLPENWARLDVPISSALAASIPVMTSRKPIRSTPPAWQQEAER